MFCHAVEPGEIRLVHNSTVTIETMGVKNIQDFFESVTDRIISPNKGGQMDIFVPLAASGLYTLQIG